MIELQDAAEVARALSGLPADRIALGAVAMMEACDALYMEPPDVLRELVMGTYPAAAGFALLEASEDADEDEIRVLYQELRNEDAGPEYLADCMARLRELQGREARKMERYAEEHRATGTGAVKEAFERIDALLARHEDPAI